MALSLLPHFDGLGQYARNIGRPRPDLGLFIAIVAESGHGLKILSPEAVVKTVAQGEFQVARTRGRILP